MSYGTSADVAVLVPRYAGTGDFTTSTNPTKVTVTTLLDQVSNLLDSTLGQYQFTTPVTDAEVVKVLTLFVTQEVAAIVEGINGSGRFGPTTKQPAKSRFTLMMEDVESFVMNQSVGFENMGAARFDSVPILTRATDMDGDTVMPLFQRKAHGENQNKKW